MGKYLLLFLRVYCDEILWEASGHQESSGEKEGEKKTRCFKGVCLVSMDMPHQ